MPISHPIADKEEWISKSERTLSDTTYVDFRGERQQEKCD